ncbi:TadE family type IV pilus minor pilin [Arthrobacter sp. StoSoilB5]|uniref:TadE family type IV pilus minor pilin n=1 Tax=Arthrobacter sp. StoSoilB5 TaxID=2830992 RepID=UPI001CC52827|nr:TadE family type IV pilus minor pilin [Arthrobacter sp. StoSoilB5]
MTLLVPVTTEAATGEREGGAVTAEFAVALPAVILLLAFLLSAGAAGITQLRLEEAARAGARGMARGETTVQVQGIVRRLAGEGATTGVTSDGRWVTVTASAAVGGSLGSLIPWTLTASASARGETPEAAVVRGTPGAAARGVPTEDAAVGAVGAVGSRWVPS